MHGIRNAVHSRVSLCLIGDNPVADYPGAKAAGISTILVRRSTPSISPYFTDLTDLARSLTSTVTP